MCEILFSIIDENKFGSLLVRFSRKYSIFFQIVSGIAVQRGISDTTVSKLQPLESVTDLAYFSKIWLYGGTLLCAITFLGFWGADAESRMGLITVINIKSMKIIAN